MQNRRRARSRLATADRGRQGRAEKRQAQEATGAACQAAKNLAALDPVPRGRAEDSGRLDVTVHLRSAKGHAPHLMPGEP